MGSFSLLCISKLAKFPPSVNFLFSTVHI